MRGAASRTRNGHHGGPGGKRSGALNVILASDRDRPEGIAFLRLGSSGAVQADTCF